MRLRGIHVSVAALSLAAACSAGPMDGTPTASTSARGTEPVSIVTMDETTGTADRDALGASRPAERSPATLEPPGPEVFETERAIRAMVASRRRHQTAGDRARRGLASTPPSWLGSRPLELRHDGFGVPLPTPPELVGRAFPPSTRLGPGGDRFEASSTPVPADVLARSTWSEGCPVPASDLAYLTLTHRGFDGESHLGEMIVHASVADDVIGVFRSLYDAGFPIEEMRVVSRSDLAASPTGDGNITTSFVCRPSVGSTVWSQHAYGLAIDVNPFQNPYRKGDVVLPELASHYLDRTLDLPGIITEGGPVVTAFDAIGWGWGGRWRTLDDYHHFSTNGR